MNRIVVSALVSGLLWTGVSAPAWAQYKVVGPDGRVTYTDRPPVDRPAQAVKSSGAAGNNPALPYALRNVVTRYPVTLYTSANCPACDGGRTLLQGRGIPFTEKTVNTTEDARVLQSREGTNSVPVIRIGSKQVTGFEQGEWTSYLDAAGYPQQSALPNGYRQPAATPLAPTANPPQLAPEADPAPKTSPEPTPAPPAGKAPPGFRF
ncbi:MAG: glutaredoxin family protein [Aquabacterium sp.]|jgi:glutaredoxin|uniref:glutaredoxin family protein n=1 Tax=Aquabacterium sp. TaxID=1872578 RepID=UPI001B697EDD|nr:glutaredoxin family protein [Aquabacterium sp.]MBP7132998.1 glutaredoxin family protein [Aquabacterium sp.]MBP9064032.1 glutaredoxin family protein [Aquabacterium sp.]MDQ5926793.1 hypothetical protein [Pseudomonadota bacterium]